MMRRLFNLLLILSFLIGGILPFPPNVQAATGVSLYTPYTGVSVAPGETIDYSFELMNDTNTIKQLTFDIVGLSQDWEYDITSGGWSLNELSVKPNDSNRFTVDVYVPLKVQKGTYNFSLIANGDQGNVSEIPLSITVTEKGTFKTGLTTEQPNMEGDTDTEFKYEAELKNRTAEEQHYALTADVPRGWSVDFEVDNKPVTSVTVPSNETKDINVTIKPAKQAKAGTYEIPIKATTSATSSELTLEAVITGRYEVEVTTPTGRLSGDITAGDEKPFTLVVKNTGTTALHDVQLKAQAPVNWEVEFEPKQIDNLEPGKSMEVQATVTADDNAIAGDYVTEFTAETPEATAKAQYRMTVETSLLWGWIGVIIIVGVIAGIFYLMRKYGRR